MSDASSVREERRELAGMFILIPSSCHCDYSCQLQMVVHVLNSLFLQQVNTPPTRSTLYASLRHSRRQYHIYLERKSSTCTERTELFGGNVNGRRSGYAKDEVEESTGACQAIVEQIMGVLAYNMLWTIVRHHQEEVILCSIPIALGSE